MNISVIGTGYVGLVTGACLAELGHNVIGVDKDSLKIEKLNRLEIPIFEPGLDELVKKNFKNGRLKFTTDLETAIDNSEVVFSAVGTPMGENHEADLSAVFSVAKIFGKALKGYKVFVNKSTVPVGTSEKVEKLIKNQSKNKFKFDVVDNPEFLREGTAVRDFMQPDRIVIGTMSEKALKIMEKIYKPITNSGAPLLITDIKSSEIIKYASNAFLSIKISFINEVAAFCEKTGGDVKEISRGMGLDHRIGPDFLNAGIGWGGSCLPKDLNAFIQTGDAYDHNFKIIKAARDVNNEQKLLLIKKLKAKFKVLNGKKIAIWGLSFKPNTDDMREAPSLEIIKALLKEKALVQAHDPVANSNAKILIKHENLNFYDNPLDAAKDADALLILTEWDEFKSVDLKKLKKTMNRPIIFDGRNLFDPEIMKKQGFNYYGVGRGS